MEGQECSLFIPYFVIYMELLAKFVMSHPFYRLPDFRLSSRSMRTRGEVQTHATPKYILALYKVSNFHPFPCWLGVLTKGYSYFGRTRPSAEHVRCPYHFDG